jgi:hypothetical protein
MNPPALIAEAVLGGKSEAVIAADEEGIVRFWNPGAAAPKRSAARSI